MFRRFMFRHYTYIVYMNNTTINKKLWEEKSLIEVNPNLSSKNVSEMPDTIPSMENKLKKNECENTGKRWIRSCPNCKSTITYKSKEILNKAIKNNSHHCKKCSNIGRTSPFKGIRKTYIGTCLDCGYIRELLHASNYSTSKKKGFRCEKCANKKKQITINSPTYIKPTIKHEEYNRLCPDCHEVVYYTSKRILDNAKYKNSKCRKCADKEHRLRCIEKRQNIYPIYNKMACCIFEDINKSLGWNLQHATNGKEYKIIGYFLDAYDKDRNIVVEYDEPHHYYKDGTMRKKDIRRQEEITKHLNCKFYRIKHNQDWKDVIL